VRNAVGRPSSTPTPRPRVGAARRRTSRWARGATATCGVDGARRREAHRHHRRHRARAKSASKRRRGVARARRIARAQCRAVAARAFRGVDRGALFARARARRRRRASETDEGNITARCAAIAHGGGDARAASLANDASVSFELHWTIGGLI
jgi:hypothetical protein